MTTEATSNHPCHVLNLDPGDRFRFRPDGPIFRRAPGPADRVWIVQEGSTLPVHRLEDYEGCLVFPLLVNRGEEGS